MRESKAGQASDIPQQMTFEGMPERLFVCTPSKLGAYEDCPRRYRYAYVDRPSPPKGPPWAHNSLGASVHSALRNWYMLRPDRRTPDALPDLLRATWVSEGYRDDAQEREVFARAFARSPHVGVAIQSYLRRSDDDIFALPEGCRVRLVKGAYLEPADVVYTRKRDVDASYARLFATLFAHGHPVDVATHEEL